MDTEKETSKKTTQMSQQDLEAIFNQNNPLNTPFFEPSTDDLSQSQSQSGNLKPTADNRGSKSSLRMKYEAEVNVIKKTHGELEDIRRQLGLPKRKMAQLLMVDPSAWTRWTSSNNEAPPHIYRALQWYLILQDKHPELKSSLWLNSVASPILSQKEVENIKKSIRMDLQKEIRGLSPNATANSNPRSTFPTISSDDKSRLPQQISLRHKALKLSLALNGFGILFFLYWAVSN
jgi:hypothetical protein